jgi:hypothetical protein
MFSKLPLTVLVVLISTITAIAGDLPNYPVEKWCSSIASVSGAKSEMVYGGCMDQEQTAYDSLKTTWADLPQQTKNWCDQIAKATGGSYMVLKACLEKEDAARRQNSNRQFQR